MMMLIWIFIHYTGPKRKLLRAPINYVATDGPDYHTCLEERDEDSLCLNLAFIAILERRAWM